MIIYEISTVRNLALRANETNLTAYLQVRRSLSHTLFHSRLPRVRKANAARIYVYKC